MNSKNLALSSLMFLALGNLAQARDGAISSGGVPPAPRAVVIQETFPEGNQPSARLEQLVRAKAGDDVASGKVQVFVQADDGVVNGFGRVRWCIEYSDYGQYKQASEEFKAVIEGAAGAEVVTGGHCGKR